MYTYITCVPVSALAALPSSSGSPMVASTMVDMSDAAAMLFGSGRDGGLKQLRVIVPWDTKNIPAGTQADLSGRILRMRCSEVPWGNPPTPRAHLRRHA